MSFWNIIDAHASAYNCFSTEIVNFPLFTDFEGKMRRRLSAQCIRVCVCVCKYNGVSRLASASPTDRSKSRRDISNNSLHS